MNELFLCIAGSWVVVPGLSERNMALDSMHFIMKFFETVG